MIQKNETKSIAIILNSTQTWINTCVSTGTNYRIEKVSCINTNGDDSTALVKIPLEHMKEDSFRIDIEDSQIGAEFIFRILIF